MNGTPFKAMVPWPPPSRSARFGGSDDAFEGFDVDRPMVFVPAIMSVGLIFSVVTLVRDVFHWTGGRARERRTKIEAGAALSQLVGEPEPSPDDLGVLSRPAYLISAIVLVGGAAYVAIGSTANFMRDEGYVRDIGWLLALSLALALALGFLGGVSLAVLRSWPHPPLWTFQPLRTAPLTTTPGRHGLGPTWTTTAAMAAAGLTTALVTLIVGSGRSIASDIDEPIARWLMESEWIGRLSVFDPMGSTIISIGFVIVIGFAGFRCRVMAFTFPTAFLISWITASVIREIVERPRPGIPTDIESFPSGHMVQAVFLAGLAPLAIAVLFSDQRAATIGRVVLGVSVVASALHRVHQGSHWPLDVVAGATLGMTTVLGVHWAIAHRDWHRDCRACPWSPHPDAAAWRRGVFQLGPATARRVGWAAAGSAIAAAGALVVATLLVGLPTDPEGSGFGSAISGPVQLGLAGLMGIAGLAALRWRAVAAALMALAATGLGLFAALEYAPSLALGLTAALLLPAVLTWLAWQPTETIGSISTLAAVTVTILTATSLGTTQIYGHYFGPTHPGSAAQDLALDEGDWVWLGAVGPTSATIVVGGLDAEDEITLQYWPTDDGGQSPRLDANTDGRRVDANGVLRFELSGLTPTTRYSYTVEELDEVDSERRPAVAEFRTFGRGPQDLVVALGSCARSGSNGAVYDAIVAEQPDLYLALGDLHYANLESTAPGDHVDQYGRSLSQAGQAALFSSVPTAYVWDDHDYGPNNSDSTSPSRLAVSTAYRQAVPHYGVDPDPNRSIAQAFTVGRVRFVLTDTRSMRTGTTMLGKEQLDWLTDELISSSGDHALVVWVNPTPWISDAGPTADDWSAHPDERQMIGDALDLAGVENLVMVSGDAHMVAIDDGTNSGYNASGNPGFPLLHAAALDRPASLKGGPYSNGAVPGAGQYGLLEVTDDGGGTIGVRLSGHNWEGDLLVELDYEVEVPPSVD